MTLITDLRYDLVVADYLAFDRGHLAEPAEVPFGLAGPDCEEGIDEILSHSRSHGSATHTEDIHMVILGSLAGRVVIVNRSCADARNFVRADGGADATAADCHAAFHVPGSDQLRGAE
jgi:hypothetical protein